MSRFMIMIERDESTVFPIVEGTDGREDCVAIYPTRAAAEAAADNTMACQAWAYTIFDLDDV
jgi:hypothetical protein